MALGMRLGALTCPASGVDAAPEHEEAPVAGDGRAEAPRTDGRRSRLQRALGDAAGRWIGELVGTYLLVVLGLGSVATSVLSGAQSGIWQVAIVWATAATLAIYAVGGLSGAHLNPAVSLAFALLRPHAFSWAALVPYVVAQVLGAAAAAATVAAFFGPLLTRYEAVRGIVRGAPGSELSAMVLTDYFPHPGFIGTDAAARALVSPAHALVLEAFGTAVLVFMVFALTSEANRSSPPAHFEAFFIGLSVAVVGSVIGPLTGGSINPARDFGPRLVAAAIGWGAVALPGPDGGFWICLVGPMVGGPLGGLIWQLVGHEHREPARVGVRQRLSPARDEPAGG